MSGVKRLLRQGLGIVLLRAGMLSGRGPGAWPTILYYHRVRPSEPLDLGLSVSPDNFEAQMRFLSRHFSVLPLDALLEDWSQGRVDGRRVAITFDDGYRDNYEHAFPVLRSLGLPAAVFVTTGYVGTNRTFWWDRVVAAFRAARHQGTVQVPANGSIPPAVRGAADRLLADTTLARPAAVIDSLKGLGPVERNRVVEQLCAALGFTEEAERAREFLDWDELLEMQEHGMTVGSHTHTHAILTETTEEASFDELRHSKLRLEEHLGRRVTIVAYPDGCVDQRTKRAAEQAGYRFGLQTQRGNPQPGDRYGIPRKKVKEGHSIGAGGRFSGGAFALEVTGVADRLLFRGARRSSPYRASGEQGA